MTVYKITILLQFNHIQCRISIIGLFLKINLNSPDEARMDTKEGGTEKDVTLSKRRNTVR